MRTLSRLMLIPVALAVIGLALACGTTFISPRELMGLLSGSGDPVTAEIFFGLRLPRVLASLVTGAALAASGTAFQSLLKNPLADPYLIGVSGGAGLGAAIAIILSLPGAGVMGASFAGGLLFISLVYALSMKTGFGSATLILSGVSLSFIASSGVMLLFAAARPDQVHRTVMWLMGDLSFFRFDLLAISAAVTAGGLLVFMLFAGHLDIISFGKDFSRSAGVGRAGIAIIFWTASLLPALSVALAGVIGFVGLIVPHVMRSMYGPAHRRLIPLSAAAGALFLCLADTIGRTVVPPYEIPAGVITGFFGGLFFLAQVIRGKSS